MMIIMMMMAIMKSMVMVMMLRNPPQFPAFLLVATRSLALRGAWFSGSACVGQSVPNRLASPRAGRARLHGLHGHWVGGGLEQGKIVRNCRNCRINRTQQNKRDSAIEGDCSYQREDRGQELHCGVARHPLNCTSCLQPRNCRINRTQQNKRDSAIKSVCSDQRGDRDQKLHCGVARHPLNCTSCRQPRNCRINGTQQNKQDSAIKSGCFDQQEDRGQKRHCGASMHPLNFCVSCQRWPSERATSDSTCVGHQSGSLMSWAWLLS